MGAKQGCVRAAGVNGSQLPCGGNALGSAFGLWLRFDGHPRTLCIRVFRGKSCNLAIFSHFLIAVTELQRAPRLSHSGYRASIWS